MLTRGCGRYGRCDVKYEHAIIPFVRTGLSYSCVHGRRDSAATIFIPTTFGEVEREIVSHVIRQSKRTPQRISESRPIDHICHERIAGKGFNGLWSIGIGPSATSGWSNGAMKFQWKGVRGKGWSVLIPMGKVRRRLRRAHYDTLKHSDVWGTFRGNMKCPKVKQPPLITVD